MSSQHRIERLAAALAAAAMLAGCGSVPTAPESESAAGAPEQTVGQTRTAEASGHQPPDAQGIAGLPAPVTEVPERAATRFARAVALMQSGNASEAELELQQLALAYPHLAGPHVNLGILHRKAGRLEPAIAALRAAVERNPASAVAWNELGVALRMHGEFQEAAVAYERAVAVDPNFAAAHRNLGVLKDLYLGDAPGALAALERYRSLTTGEEKPVSGWIAELRHRTGTPAAPAADAAKAAAPPNEGA